MSQPTSPTTLGPVSKRHQHRITNRRINAAAADADAVLWGHIEGAATELGVLPTEVFQYFTIISPIGEQRSPMWWNGFVAEKSIEWKDEYEGPGRQYLSWVTHRICEEGLADRLTDEEKAQFADVAAVTQAENKDAKTTGLSRKKVVAAGQERLAEVHSQLETLHHQLGFEYMLVATRGKLEDDMAPLYASSNKVNTFLQGHMNMPMKDVLTHMDFYVIGEENAFALAGTKKIEGKRQALHGSVRTRLINSLREAIKKTGGDPSNIRSVEYANYDKIVYNHRVILCGYPLAANERQLIRPSDFPGGIKGLMHADNQLASGVWHFEDLPAAAYNKWKVEYEKAIADESIVPPPPYTPVPGSKFKKGPVRTQSAEGSQNPKPRKRKQQEAEPGAKAKKANGKFKSHETIVESDSEEETNEAGSGDD